MRLVCIFAHLFVTLTSSKILPFGKLQINLHFRSLIRIFVPMKRIVFVLSALVLSLGMWAQQYRPEGRAFVCVNGQHRFTRALYGSPTEWRVETSDRPVFALYKKNNSRNVQFRVNGVRLDETDFCEARYEDGMRSYLLRHKSWGQKATLRVKVVASLQAEQAIWRFQTADFSGDATLEVVVSNIRNPNLLRNDDFGADPRDAFEADGKKPVQKWSQTFDEECYVCCDGIVTNKMDEREASERFEEMETAMHELAARVEFNTPDPYVNTLGGALVVAADGDWDGKTWLYGCIGVDNFPLTEWRAGYLGDVLGWPGRAISHFDVHAKSQINELLWHFQYDADKAYLKKMWPVLKDYLAKEKSNHSGEGVTRSLAYNYRANKQAARIARLIGEDGTSYQKEADVILKALNERLWLKDKGHWAEYQDQMGLKRVHESAAVWSIYTPIDCGACTPEQAYQATKYIDSEIPHIPVNTKLSTVNRQLSTISTSNWMPYSWSINNVVAAEVMHTALAYFEAGRSEEGYQLMMANVMDQMYDGQSPANFGLISKYDAFCGERYRDFGDCIGISARTLIQGLFGIQPDALEGRCIIRPGFPEAWDSASVRTPYIYYKYQRRGDEAVYEVTQHFARPQKIVIRQNLGMGKYRDIVGNSDTHQVIRVKVPVKYPEVTYKGYVIAESQQHGTDEPTFVEKFHKQNIDRVLNDSVTNIFRHNHSDNLPVINDSVFRSMIVKDEFIAMGVPFRTYAEGRNIAFTSLLENYPDSISIPLSGRYRQAWLLLAGTTNYMQSRIANGIVVAQYQDGTADSLQLVNPDNWCPIECDYYVDGLAFRASQPRPYRVAFASGTVSRNLGQFTGGAATMLRMPLNRQKKLESLTLHALSNDVVIGLMAVTLQ